MNKKTYICMAVALVINSVSFAVDLQDGKETYEADCVKCHDSSVFTRPSSDRKVNDLPTLVKQVKACANATGAAWFEEDEENVVAYLNKTFYQFKNDK